MPVGPKAAKGWKYSAIAIDCETSGVDFKHGARPFFVTVAVEGNEANPYYWEWPVDPLTRTPRVDPADLDEIMSFVNNAKVVVGQNIKFDVKALRTLMPDLRWPWGRTFDTLLAAHLLASNRPKDLTSLALQFLAVNIKPEEDRLSEVCNAARRYARSHHPDWRIAKAGESDMPSAKETVHKFDMWLPRALVEAGDPVPDNYRTALRDYSTADSAVTMGLYHVMKGRIEAERWPGHGGYGKVFADSMKLPPIIFDMEEGGVTISKGRTFAVREEMISDAKTAGDAMVAIAKEMGHDIVLPKAGRNKSIMEFAAADTGLNFKLNRDEMIEGSVFVPTDRRTDTGNLSLSAKEHIPYYIEQLKTIDPDGPRLKWLRHLAGKSKRDTAVSYMDGYERFWLPATTEPMDWTTILPQARRVIEAEAETFILYPSFNQTGTDTLRFSCTNPNAQNISKQEAKCDACKGDPAEMAHCKPCRGSGVSFRSVRYCFGPAPGREWWSCDFKNLELRLPFYESGETELIALFENPDEPPYYGSNHLLNFHTAYPDIWDEAVKEVGLAKAGPHCKKKYANTYYQWCKNGGFALQYQAGEATADAAFRRPGCFRKIKSRFARLDALNAECVRFANKHGYIETIPDREVDPKRGYPLLCTRTERGGVKPTVPLSYRIQGTAMHLTRRAMIKCHAKLSEWRDREGFNGRITMQVHDELVFDLPKAADPATDPDNSNLPRIRVLQDLMAQGGEALVVPGLPNGIPTPAGAEYHPCNWAEGVSL